MGSGCGLEWPATLDVPGLQAGGWRPVPFREFVVKIHSRCDLACDYCYMYEMADQSWRDRPRRMSEEIAEYTATRIGDHARRHRITGVTLILHGGEPLLAGRELISHLVTATRREAGTSVRVDASVQTNGIGLNDSYLTLFRELGVRVGVSLDGAAAAHDRHRRFASGRGSYAAVTAGLHRLIQAPFRHLFSGLLCTIDLRNDPLATYKALAGRSIRPGSTSCCRTERGPRRRPGGCPMPRSTPYADWLIAIFDHWYRAPHTRIRLFEEIMHLLLGGSSATEMVGLSPSRVCHRDRRRDRARRHPQGGLPRRGGDRASRGPGPARRGAAAARCGGPPARAPGAVGPVPGLPHPPGLRRRPLRSSLSPRHRLLQSVGVLPGPHAPHRPHLRDHAGRYRSRRDRRTADECGVPPHRPGSLRGSGGRRRWP